MPQKVGSKWRWGNIERGSKKELAQTVYGIWKKNGSKGDFGDFWRKGKVEESCEPTIRQRRLDFLENKIIQESYRKMYCGNRSYCNMVNEGANDVPTMVSMPTADLDRAMARQEQKEREEYLNSLPENERNAILARERAEKRRAEERRRRSESLRGAVERKRNTPVMRAVSQEEIAKREEMKMQADEARRAYLRSAQASSDPAMRIGTGVYDGLGWMLPGAMLGRVAKEAKAAKAVQGAVAAEKAAERAPGFLRTAYDALNKVNGKNFWYKVPAGVAVSRGIEAGVEKGADALEAGGHKKEAKLLRGAGGWAPFIVAPVGSATRYSIGPGVEYVQDKFGGEESGRKVGRFQDLIGYDSDYSQKTQTNTENGGENGNENGETVQTQEETYSEECPECSFKTNSYDELLKHYEAVHMN